MFSTTLSQVTSSLTQFTNVNNLSYLNAKYNGGFIYVDNNAMDLSMNSALTVTESHADLEGGLFYFR